jgi:ferric-dicitrate binding protein FerR (iron transport regulator)
LEKHQFLALVDKYLAGKASEEEEQQLLRFFDSFQGEAAPVKNELEEKMLLRLMKSVEKKRSPVWLYTAIAAALIGLIVSIVYTSPQKQQLAITNIPQQKESNKVLLKLADGSTIELNKGNAGITKLLNKTGKNTITTPGGTHYQLTLPDGTLVWLNAQSSLTFPTIFEKEQRTITLKGEAYFEVAKASTPFYVNAGGNEVAVLGTHFNVMAYADAATFETTLLEGAVQVKHGTLQQRLNPGEQAVVTDEIKIKQVNTDAVVAWKEGLFLFDNTSMDDAMQQIKRWYNVEVVYQGAKPAIEFTGVLPRSSSVMEVLNLLESSAEGVHFEVDNNKIIVK